MTGDDDLLNRLRQAAERAGPVPRDVTDAAKAAFLLRDLDARLAELVSDSATVAGAVRAPGESVRLMAFETGDVTVEVHVEQTGTAVTIRGMVTGATGRVVVQTPDGDHALDLDDDGWFAVVGVAGGPTRVRLTAADGSPVVTSWVLT